MGLTINSLRALTKLTQLPGQRYFVLAYFLPPQPYTSAEEGEVHGYVCPLASFAHESEALEYRRHVEEVTQHPAIFAADAMTWSVLGSHSQGNRIRHTPKTLETDISAFYRKLRDQEQVRAQLVESFEAQLKEENDPESVKFYGRALYEGVKLEEQLKELEERTAHLRELLREKKSQVQTHHRAHPEHDTEVTTYLQDHLGDLNATVYQHYLAEWTRSPTLLEQMRGDEDV